MDQLRQFLESVRDQGTASGRFRGLLHVLIGRRISLPDGTVISTGMTWRNLAALLKKYRWDREAVRELGIDPADLPPRDREKYWYTAINRAGITTPAAIAEADALTEPLRQLGYQIGASDPPPSTT